MFPAVQKSLGFVCAPILLAASLGLVRAQESDTIVLKNSEKFTLVSQIQDPREAEAFLAIRRASDPKSRFDLAQQFLTAYPQSWLLAQTYDISARSAIDLARYDDALAAGRFSLRLVRENPSLLILLANVEARQGLFDRATADASDALEYLDQIERPPATTESQWDVLKPQLKSSAFFARARVETARGMAKAPADLHNAFRDLNYAAAWNPQDTEVFYLRAVVEIQLGDKRAAASDLAYVAASDNPLTAKAKNVLAILAKQISIQALPPPAIETSLRRQVQPNVSKALAYGYAGPATCQPCHASEYAAWKKTGMARMLQPYRRENVIGDFSQGARYSEGPDDSLRMGIQGRPYFELSSHAGWTRYYVDFTIGSKWQQGYATRLPDGRLQVLPIQYNLLEKKWINYWKIIDPPSSSRTLIHDFPKFTPATNYQQNCAICHTSQLKVPDLAANSMEHAAYLQPGVDCEMCHGPSAWHSKQASKGAWDHPDPTQPPFDFRNAGNRDAVRVCAQCHRQSAVREFGEGGEMNYSTKGSSFLPAAWLRPADAFSRKAFYKDGRFRETTFIVESFTRSACYLRGAAQCATCHSPHLSNFETNPTSLKFKTAPDEMCLPCHSEYRNRIAEHSHHAPGSEASQCVSCHMPRVVNALLFKARSHQIEVPTADLTERFGQPESPNVCLVCHSEKSVGWAKDQLASWHPINRPLTRPLRD